MFVVDGYTQLAEIRKRFNVERLETQTRIDLNRKVKISLRFSKNRQMGDFEQERLKDPTLADIGIDAEEVREMFTDSELEEHAALKCELAFSRYVKQVGIFLTGPNSQVIPIGHELLERPFPNRVYGAKGWYFLDNRSLTINVESFIKNVEAMQMILAWDDGPNLTRNGRAAMMRLVEREPTARILLPYQGFSVCILNTSLPDTFAIRRALFLDVTDEPNAERKTGKGRPRKMEEAKDAYERHFPDGHIGLTWKVVLRILRAEEGIVVGEDTLRNALNADFGSRNT